MYKNLNEVESVIALGKPMEVVDMFLESYLQGVEYSKWVEGKDLSETVDTIATDENGYETTVSTLVNIYIPVDVSAQVAQWKIHNKLEKKYGKDYNGFMVPFMNEDAIALLQVKTLFEMGGTATNVEFSNGVVMPMVAIDFQVFASWFVNERNGYFL